MHTNLKADRPIRLALTQVYGLGPSTAQQLCDQLGFHPKVTTGSLKAGHWDQLARIVSAYHITGAELKRVQAEDIQRTVRMSSYKGFRFTQGLPLRGQRTHTNARTARKHRRLKR